MHAGADNGGGNASREIAVTDQTDAGAGGPNVGNQFFVARPVKHDHNQVFHVAIQTFGNILQIVGNGSVEPDRVLARRPAPAFFHVAVWTVPHTTAFGSHANP